LPRTNCWRFMEIGRLDRKNCKNDIRKIDSLIMMTLGWMTSGSICIYKYGSSINSANDQYFESHFCKSPNLKWLFCQFGILISQGSTMHSTLQLASITAAQHLVGPLCFHHQLTCVFFQEILGGYLLSSSRIIWQILSIYHSRMLQ